MTLLIVIALLWLGGAFMRAIDKESYYGTSGGWPWVVLWPCGELGTAIIGLIYLIAVLAQAMWTGVRVIKRRVAG